MVAAIAFSSSGTQKEMTYRFRISRLSIRPSGFVRSTVRPKRHKCIGGTRQRQKRYQQFRVDDHIEPAQDGWPLQLRQAFKQPRASIASPAFLAASGSWVALAPAPFGSTWIGGGGKNVEEQPDDVTVEYFRRSGGRQRAAIVSLCPHQAEPSTSLIMTDLTF